MISRSQKNMGQLRPLLVVLLIVASSESRGRSHSRRSSESLDICAQQPAGPNSGIQCYCRKNPSAKSIKSAECFLISKGDNESHSASYDQFKYLSEVMSVSFTKDREIAFQEIPTEAIAYLNSMIRLDIKYENVTQIRPYAFANHSRLEELTLSNNQIEHLHKNAFAHLERVAVITLDKNDLEEINRDVFVDLPTLEKLFLTSNKLSTIHDRAFEHLGHLKELELDKNSLFALTNETFYGLTSLRRLELSNNALEVIGDYTFIFLSQLQYLNLQGNRIQLLDGKAFAGLSELQYLSLSYNKLISLGNEELFKGLASLSSLHLSGNKLQELKQSVFKPILPNFYEIMSNFDIESNNLPCSCDLEWLIRLQNQTKNSLLKNHLENLTCQPDPALADAWKKFEEAELTEEEPTTGHGNDYEYYDSSQLGGKLFYTDIRQILNCTKDKPAVRNNTQSFRAIGMISSSPIPLTRRENLSTTQFPSIPTTYVSIKTQARPHMAQTVTSTTPLPRHVPYKTLNRGLLDLSAIDEPAPDSKPASTNKNSTEESDKSAETMEEKLPNFTTSRVTNVSEKPKSTYVNDENEMASDEAMLRNDKQKYSTEPPGTFSELAQEESLSNSRKGINCLQIYLIAMPLTTLFLSLCTLV